MFTCIFNGKMSCKMYYTGMGYSMILHKISVVWGYKGVVAFTGNPATSGGYLYLCQRKGEKEKTQGKHTQGEDRGTAERDTKLMWLYPWSLSLSLQKQWERRRQLIRLCWLLRTSTISLVTRSVWRREPLMCGGSYMMVDCSCCCRFYLVNTRCVRACVCVCVRACVCVCVCVLVA